MSNGEKISPVDMENAIAQDPLFDHVMLLGEAKPFLSVVAVLNAERWQKVAAEHGVAADPGALASKDVQNVILTRVAAQLGAFPGYAQVRRAVVTLEAWTIENGFLTPTMKLKRAKVMDKFNAEIDAMYAGH